MEGNKVKVRIYGQEYTISGERDEKTIIKVAEYVDSKMREAGRYFSVNAQGSLGVLTAVNIADEYFSLQEEKEEIKAAKEQLEKDAQHYLKMWDEAKKSFLQYKENAAKSLGEKQEIEERYKQLEEKCKEYENSFFDLQMENVQLKNEMKKNRGTDE